MTERDQLDRLCELAGIETSYWDLGGTLHEVPGATKSALLVAMGHEIETQDAIETSINALEMRRWGRCLAPVCVLRQGEPAGIIVTHDVTQQEQEQIWRLEYEQGGFVSGAFYPDHLERRESRRIEGRDFIRRVLPLPGDMPAGYHELTISGGRLKAKSRIIVTPKTAFRPEAIRGGKAWGAAHQLYALRSPENQGIGDFSDLARLGASVAQAGGAVLGLNPLHALFPSAPEKASPYAPSSRNFINPLYIDVTAIPESAQYRNPQGQEQETALVDHEALVAHKLPALRRAFARFEAGRDADRRADLARFSKEGGAKLYHFALYQALEAHFGVAAQGWPPEFQNPDSAEVARFARQKSLEINFHVWLQWIAQGQLERAARQARQSGLSIGLYGDLAVGVDAWGADAWGSGGIYVRGVEFGAPPDPFSADGQNWGMPPLDPIKLREAAYQPFIDMLRANMRHMGALRIDHVMWLQRMFWIPQGKRAVDGTYIRYPVDDLMGILALESQRHECLVIGEDLGTVPGGFAEKMESYGLFSYRLMRFERYPDGLFKRPSTYKPDALAMFGSHDLPPIAGYREGRDLDELAKLGRLEEGAREARRRDLEMLSNALRDQQLWPEGADTDMEAIILAVHRFLARSSSALMMVNLEDVLALREQVNIPGTYLECPNWRRRLPKDLDDIHARLMQLGPVLGEERKLS